MQFNSGLFLFIFLPVTILAYFLLNRYTTPKLAAYALIIASFVFYGYAGVSYLIYFVCCILINYIAARLLIKYRKKSLLLLGLLLNLGSLGFLKYYNFFVGSVNSALKSDFNLINVFMPLGLSFFTFQFVALIYDCYKGNIVKLPFIKYLLFASFFPKITQGPIMLYQSFDEQYSIDTPNNFQAENFSKGLYAFTLGMSKKILVADILGSFVNSSFSGQYAQYNSTMLLLMVLAYTLQIYFDFSGYSDMARGLGLMFNLELPVNFNSPYKALSVNDFWKRWHMSLTGFFTKYLYIPLGGSRKGELKTYRNVLLVFIFSGLWHGANYTFIVWGALHGIISVIERKLNFTKKLSTVLQWVYTFVFVNISWLFFRANSLTQAWEILRGIVKCDFSGVNYASFTEMIPAEFDLLFSVLNIEKLLPCIPLLFILLLVIAVLQLKNTEEKLETFRPTFGKALFIIVFMSWCILSFGSKTTFIYEMF